jgi:hypothetical protein
MHIISGNTLSNAVLRCYDTILEKGYDGDSRNGKTKTLYNVLAEIRNPRSRHLYLAERKSNIFQMIAETFWVMAGDDRLDPYLSFFLPRAKDYSDDGRTWFSAYGPRLYMFDQLEGVLDTFHSDGRDTRRAYLSIQMPHTDAPTVVADTLNGCKPKDISCNQMVQFYVEGGKTFHTKVIQRSGDIIFGTGSINPFEFSFLHELMFNEVKKQYPEIELGSYIWDVTNMHMYEWSGEQAVKAVEHDNNWGTSEIEGHTPLIGPDITDWQEFFGDLVRIYSMAIEDDSAVATNLMITELGFTFDRYQIPVENNILWTYVQLVARYIGAKKGFDMGAPLDMISSSTELKMAIHNSTFRKFEVVT